MISCFPRKLIVDKLVEIRKPQLEAELPSREEQEKLRNLLKEGGIDSETKSEDSDSFI